MNKHLNVNELKQSAKIYARIALKLGRENDIDTLVDAIVDAAVKAAIAELMEHYQVDVPNTGYFGVIVSKE